MKLKFLNLSLRWHLKTKGILAVSYPSTLVIMISLYSSIHPKGYVNIMMLLGSHFCRKKLAGWLAGDSNSGKSRAILLLVSKFGHTPYLME
jgi:hypothetical protein